MAKVNVLTTANFDMMSADIGDLYEAEDYEYGTTFFKAVWESGMEYDLFTGTSFSYSAAGDPISGTVTGYKYYNYGNIVEVTNASIPATTVASFAQADNTVGAFKQVLSGNDSLTGNAGRDGLYGYDGNDTINGGANADTMVGGQGNDVYLVNTATDVVVELAGQGTDLIKSTVSYSLLDTDGVGSSGGNVENLTLTGTAAQGTGNNANNVLKGNATDNKLLGHAGADRLFGNNGNDDLFGHGGNDTLKGGDGWDWLIGGTGNDVLYGGGGRDDFFFFFAPNALTNVDTIPDFSIVQDDHIMLDDDVFKGLGSVSAETPLAARKFYKAAGATTAHDADDRIIYNSGTGVLYYDADGTGATHAPIQFAKLGTTSHPNITAADFAIIA